MQRSIEQRFAIKFCVKLGKSPVKTFRMIKTAFGDDSLSERQVFRWHKAFLEGREEVSDEVRVGRPLTTTINETVVRVRELLNTDRRLSVRLVSQTLNIPKSTVHEIVMNNLQMQKVWVKLVPKVLTDNQRSRRLETCQELWNLYESDPHFLDNVITDDESWVFKYDPETKRQSVEWHTLGSPRIMKARMSKSKIKTMIIVFFDIRGLVQHEFVPHGTIINTKFYVEILKRLKRRVHRVRPEITDNWKLHHDYAPAHTAFLVTQFLADSKVPTIPQPPYSPNLAPLDFFLFPRLKTRMKSNHFETVDKIKDACTRIPKDIPEVAYRDAFDAWKSRWKRYIDARGSYFEFLM
uniref:Putative DD34D transposase n=1 Tax=Schlechtendalia chinensis TaxID=38111 RepID=A0A8F5HT98_9HEMI|nr:putative DD34D transposase [Schlechtendalia chinensis]